MYRYIEQSGQGHRFEVMTPDNRRICIAHSESDAKLLVKSLDAEARKAAVIKAGMGRKILRDATANAGTQLGTTWKR